MANFNKVRVSKIEDYQIPLSSIDGLNNGETLQCVQGAYQVSTVVAMLEKWLSYTNITI